MITNAGNLQVLKLMAGTATQFANTIAVGSGSVVLPVTATSLGFSWGLTTVVDTFVDTSLGQVIFHGVLAPESSGVINEIGLIATGSNSSAQSSTLANILYTFGSNETWLTSAPYTLGTGGNIGMQDYIFTNATDGTSLLTYLSILSTFTFSTLKFACTAVGITSVEIRLEIDPANYLSTIVSTTAAGLQIYNTTIANYTTTGVVNVQNIKALRLIIHPAGTSSTLTLDGLSLEMTAGSALIAHSVLATPIVKAPGAPLEIERAVKFSA